MKYTKLLLNVLTVLTVLTFLASCNHALPDDGITPDDRVSTEGRVVANGSSYLIVEEDGPISMENAGDADIFKGLTTGDLIRITRDAEVRESYPGQVRVYSCEKLSDGEVSDISDDVAASLIELGWMKKPVSDTDEDIENGTSNDTQYSTENNYGIMLPYETGPDYVHKSVTTELVSYEYKYASMSIRVPEGWDYTVSEYTENCYSFGITVFPEHKPDAKITLMYYPGMFAVCGTGLTEEKTTLSGFEANKGFYDGGQIWDFIAADEYALVNQMPTATFLMYRDDIELMIGSVVIGEGVINRAEAIKIAVEALPDVEPSHAVGDFDYAGGIWTVRFYNDSSFTSYSRCVDVDHVGNVVKIYLAEPAN